MGEHSQEEGRGFQKIKTLITNRHVTMTTLIMTSMKVIVSILSPTPVCCMMYVSDYVFNIFGTLVYD